MEHEIEAVSSGTATAPVALPPSRPLRAQTVMPSAEMRYRFLAVGGAAQSVFTVKVKDDAT